MVSLPDPDAFLPDDKASLPDTPELPLHSMLDGLVKSCFMPQTAFF
jgi:hypothetical protein